MGGPESTMVTTSQVKGPGKKDGEDWSEAVLNLNKHKKTHTHTHFSYPDPDQYPKQNVLGRKNIGWGGGGLQGDICPLSPTNITLMI